MPFFNTGNTQWDQGFNTLGGALFPDPSKIGQATYYGAEARKAQIDAAAKQEQLAAGHRQLNMVFGQTPGQPTYSGTGPLNVPILSEPPPMDGGGGGGPPPGPAPGPAPAPAAPPPPAAAAPSPAPAAAAPSPAPAAGPGPVGSNMPPGALSALFAQGGGAVPQQSQWVPQTMSPANAAQTIATKLDAQPNATSGASPPVSPPAPGAPPAPNTTGSDGSTPPSQAQGVLHPGSLTSQGGGMKMSGPAAADGSPAPAAFNLAQYMALGVMHGLPPDQALAQGRAVIAEWVKNGQMDVRTADNILAGIGVPNMRVAGIEQAGAITRTGMEVAGRKDVAGMEIAGRKDVAGMPTTFVPNADDPTQGRFVPLSAQQGGTVTGYNPAAVTAATTPVLTQPGGPGTPPQSTPQFKAGGQPIYQPTIEAERQKPGTYIDPKNPTQLIPATPDDAMKRGLVSAPTTMDGWNALAASASANVSDPAQAQAIRDKVLAFATASTPKPVDARENVRNQNIIDKQLQTLMPVPPSDYPGSNTLTNLKPAGASPELGMTLSNLTDQYFQRSTDPAIRGNRIAAANAALKQMIAQGYIDPKQSRAQGIRGQTSINKGVLNQDGTVDQVEHFRVDLIDPKTKQPYAAGQSPDIKMTTPLSSVVTGGGNKGTMPQGALGPAPPGVPDGTPGTTSTGQRGVVRGGWVFPAS